MNYSKIYNNLVQRGKSRKIPQGEYFERHHIIPKCMGGTDDEENFVDFYPEEHYLSHLLLVKIYPNNEKLVYSAMMMGIGNPETNQRSNKTYGWLRRKHSNCVSQHFKDYWSQFDPEQRSKILKERFSTKEQKEKKSIIMLERYQDEKYYDKFITTMTEVNKRVDKKENAGNTIRKLWEDSEYREKTIKSRLGIVWWTNGIDTVKSKECPGENWYRGRRNKGLGTKKRKVNIEMYNEIDK